MKKSVIVSVLLAGFISLNSCQKKETGVGSDSSNVVVTDLSGPVLGKDGGTPSEAKTFKVTATPDTFLLGKNKEASVKILNLKAVELSDPDGKVTGIEMSYDLELTNTNTIAQGGYIQLEPSQFRLVLDNGSKISHDNYNSVSANADETKLVSGNSFKMPAGTKPVSLNLYYDETIVNAKLDLN